MRQADLTAALQKQMEDGRSEAPTQCIHVIDGGCLLHQLRWTQSNSVDQIWRMYDEYLRTNFSIVTIVFNGNENGLSTKDHERSRTCCTKISAEVIFPGTDQVRCFLANERNIAAFLNFLAHLRNCGNSVIECKNGVEVKIVCAALRYASEKVILIYSLC